MPFADAMIEIRKALPEDAEAIARVHTGTWRHSYRGYVSDAFLDPLVVNEGRISRWREILNDPNPNRCVVVAVMKGGVVGFVSGGTDFEKQQGYDSQIKAIYVEPGAQRSGVGRRLTRAFVEFVLVRNARNMILWTIAEGPSTGFYLALGAESLPLRDSIGFGAEKIPVAAYVWPDLCKLRSLLGGGGRGI